ncbi:retinol dehydrogenase 13-like [Haliotis rubra]|uniref:retinol dehydrogenase 13-like n=1 Tax=Haliotis rubra TaxID=36100 RepID=UPI001EE5378E|nr:retinol dehydrogenase 13-like [Haliotis rubra]XP_046585025.1 retinol dehydrogenase 13-like [Haliotis rubra]
MGSYSMPKYAVPLSALGTLMGGIYLLKDYMGGGKYTGEERLAGRTVVITGANTGIGKEVARDLAKRGSRVIMACRDLDKCERARAEIVVETANRNIKCQLLDLASIGSIKAFAKAVNQNEKRLDILINNAGIMRCPKLLTEDGFEMQLGVNHLGHFLLTHLLLDKLKASAPSRIINVSSLAHSRGRINFEDLNSATTYNPSGAYEQSKLANVLFTVELAKRLKDTGVTCNAVNPGLVKTEIGRHLSVTKSYISSFLLFPFLWLMLKTPRQGAQTTLYAALDPKLATVTGKYFSDCEEQALSQQVVDEAAMKRLWVISEKWTRIT